MNPPVSSPARSSRNAPRASLSGTPPPFEGGARAGTWHARAMRRACWIIRVIGIVWVVGMLPIGAAAGGQGPGLIPPPLPDRDVELRIVSGSRMICVDDPATECQGVFLDRGFYGGGSGVANGFRALNCPGALNRCRPDFVTGAELSSTLTIDYSAEYFPDEQNPVQAQYDATFTLDVTAPGITVDNPILEESFSALQNIVGGFEPGLFIPPWGFTQGATPNCQNLEYASQLPRDQLLEIGRDAFPAALCNADANGDCQVEPEVVLVDMQGKLEFGCNQTIRFALPNRPVDFGRGPTLPFFHDIGDVDGDLDDDLLVTRPDTFLSLDHVGTLRNDGNNGFGSTQVDMGLLVIPFTTVLALEDFDGDLDLDLYYSWDDPSGFPPRIWGIAPGSGSGTVLGGSIKGFTYGSTFRFGEYVAGGNIDLMLIDTIYTDTGGGSYASVGGPITTATLEAEADFESDGDDDFVSISTFLGTGSLAVHGNDGTGIFSASTSFVEPLDSFWFDWEQSFCALNPYSGFSLPCELKPLAADALDVNGDGRLDLVTVLRLRQHAEDSTLSYDVDSRWIAWAENGATPGGGAPFEPGGDVYRVIGRTSSDTLVIGDVDGDGLDDIASGLLWYRNTGSGFTGPHGVLTGPAVDQPETRHWVRDLDQDGAPEIILGTTIYDVDAPPACANGIDDDGDGMVDTADPGCADAADEWETNSSVACDDGLDNDGDGAVDAQADVGCFDSLGIREDPQCQNGIDDDGQIGTDFDGGESILGAGNGDPNGADPQCSSFSDNREATGSGGGCGLGAELLVLLGGLGMARGARRRRR